MLSWLVLDVDGLVPYIWVGGGGYRLLFWYVSNASKNQQIIKYKDGEGGRRSKEKDQIVTAW